MPLELLWLLLPVAAASGWMAARRGASQTSRATPDISPDYFKGINYLLNEQPDKAIEVFIKMLEVDSETVETHLALGNLFRRRGEVDRAIRIHQNLIARPSLSRQQRAQALLELGQDYRQAGLFDRAEILFKELTEVDDHAVPALRLLNKIYEQEKEWDKAISVVQELERRTGTSLKDIIAHYYCELAVQSKRGGDISRATNLIKRALSCDRNCVRASILYGAIQMAEGDYKSAVKTYKRVNEQDADYLSEVVEPLLQCYIELGKPQAMYHYLEQVVTEQKGIKPVLYFAEYLKQHRGDHAAADFIVSHLQLHPSLHGLNRLIELNLEQGARNDLDSLAETKKIIDKLLENQPLYYCDHCGFSGKIMHWYCPGCQSWNSVKPFQTSRIQR